jgi:cysteine sulfinate desulfinase/cysteine desulfurase-like protein
MGLSPTVAKGSVRFSLGMENTHVEMEYTANVLEEVVRRLRSIAPPVDTDTVTSGYGGGIGRGA